MTASVARDERPLGDRLLDRIRDAGPLRFDAFMEAALYDPHHGYYSGGAGGMRAGPAGDFVTAPTMSDVFHSAFARFVRDAWRGLGEPRDWLLVEPGAGTGALSAGIATALEGVDEAAARGQRALAVDVSPAHRDAARRNLERVLRRARVEVTDHLPALDAPAVVVANELLDNLPVRLLLREEGRWWERAVGLDEAGAFAFTKVEAPADLVSWAGSFRYDVPDRHQVEVPVGQAAWLGTMGAACGSHPAVMALVDYGETARDLFTQPRPQGTLLAYEGHKRDRDVLKRPGTRDVTAHVNWTAVARAAQDAGWDVVSYTDQFSFLSSLGALEDAVRLAQKDRSVEAMERLYALKEVLLPGGMGEAVKVLVLSRGIEDASWLALERERELEPGGRH